MCGSGMYPCWQFPFRKALFAKVREFVIFFIFNPAPPIPVASYRFTSLAKVGISSQPSPIEA